MYGGVMGLDASHHEGRKVRCCPLCGRRKGVALPPLFVLTDRNTIFVDGRPIEVSPRIADLAALLAEARPAAVTRGRIMATLYGPDERPTGKRLNVLIHRLRKALAGTGWDVVYDGASGFALLRPGKA